MSFGRCANCGHTLGPNGCPDCGAHRKGKGSAVMRLIPFLLTYFTIIIVGAAFASERLPERHYQDKWCSDVGITEYILPDRARVDCLTNTHAIEFDFAHKWAEAIGQSLYYARMTNRQAGIALIAGDDDERYISRLMLIADELNITVWLIEKE